VAIAIASTVVAAALAFKIILPDPKSIERVLLLDELKIGTVRLLLLRVIVPEVSVSVLIQRVGEPDRDRLTTPPVGLATVVLDDVAVAATVTV
jgi:hypothetical protein